MSALRRFVAARVVILTCALAVITGAPLLAQGDTSAAQEDIAVAPPSLVVGEPAGQPLTGEALEAETERIGSLVRCPVCQGLSVTDSPAPMAVKMKGQTRDLVAEGYTEEQILSYFERSYGEFVLLSPPLRGINWLVWLAPGILLLIGLVVVVLFFRRSAARTAEDAPGEVDPAEPVDPYVMEVRRLAYGDEETSR